MTLIQKTRVLAKLKQILTFIRNYPQIVWNNINSNGLTIEYRHLDSIVTYSLNGLWTLVFALGYGIAIALVVIPIVFIAVALTSYIEYRLFVRKFHRNITWREFIEYKKALNKSVRGTRGGDINIKIFGLFEAIDASANFFRPIIENIKRSCFAYVGLYRIGKYLEPVIERLRLRGLVREITLNGQKIEIVNIDVLLLTALEHHSLSLLRTDLLNLRIGLHEFSTKKLLFNFAMIFSIAVFSGSTLLFGIAAVILNCFGYAETTLLAAKIAQISLGTLLTSGITYVGGQFIPPVNCLPFGEHIKPGRADDEQPISFIGDKPYAYSPPDVSENYVRLSRHIDPDFANKFETEVHELPTLGSIETAPDPSSLRGSRVKAPTKSYSDLVWENSPQFEDAPLVRPKQQRRSIYEELK